MPAPIPPPRGPPPGTPAGRSHPAKGTRMSASTPKAAGAGVPTGSGSTGAPSASDPGSNPPALAKKMRWYDGFAMSLTMPAALIASLGASIGGLGAWGAIALWAGSMVLATIANWIYTELAAMFPESSGGIAHYATEAWKKRAPFVGPLASIGYW